MAGISSKAAGKLENRFKFNDGTELTTDLALDWYETDFRSYDAQLGRFHQIDPLGELFEYESLYVFGGNNPILLNDPLGLSKTTDSTRKASPKPTYYSNADATNEIGTGYGDQKTFTTTDAAYFISFETGIIPINWGGQWSVSNSKSYDGTYSLRSLVTQNSSATFTITLKKPGQIIFY